jgi:hypothetical protein
VFDDQVPLASGGDRLIRQAAQTVAARSDRDGDLAQAGAVKHHPWRLFVAGTRQVAQLRSGSLLEALQRICVHENRITLLCFKRVSLAVVCVILFQPAQRVLEYGGFTNCRSVW